MSEGIRAAFYDFDGTLVSSNVVTRYAFFAKTHPSRWEAWLRYGKLLLTVPLWIGLDLYSRRLFNRLFYREYGGFEERWLREQSERMFEADILPKVYPGAKDLVAADREQGYRLVLVSGGLDFALAPAVRFFGFEDAICNTLVYREGTATGEVTPPLLAEARKFEAIREYCRKYNVDTAHSKAYSDSLSDLPMLEAVGNPTAVNPGRRMRQAARQRGWPVLDLRASRQA
jgi:HAD superfamily hydrolase (TIGR01490 family)